MGGIVVHCSGVPGRSQVQQPDSIHGKLQISDWEQRLAMAEQWTQAFLRMCWTSARGLVIR
jgi:hypothetical protein